MTRQTGTPDTPDQDREIPIPGGTSVKKDSTQPSPATAPPKQKSRSNAGSLSPVLYIALTGNPNSGKTTLFNSLTGLRAKVGNYAGVTVERKEGRLLGAPTDVPARVLDLPGTYSLSPQSLDERISRDVLLNRLRELPAPALIVIVVDASNLQRNLYYATQVIELGRPTIVALNMVDVAEAHGHRVDSEQLAKELGVPVIPVVASSGKGVPELKTRMISMLREPGERQVRIFSELPRDLGAEAAQLTALLATRGGASPHRLQAEALLILCNEKALDSSAEHYPREVRDAVLAARQRLEAAGVDWRGAAIESRYAAIARIQEVVSTETRAPSETISDKLDRVLTHKVWGTLIFCAIMAFMFQSIFTFARIPMNLLQGGVDWLGTEVGRAIPPGDLNSLVVDGVIAGVGAVIVFLPQILLLFLFIGFLEDTGYMARAAFLMDRLMSKVGLHGKSFIPLLSSFACAIPGIMAARTIESPKDRFATIMIAPLMSCSARLPVYTLLIAACIPNIRVLGFLRLPGLTMMGMYLLGIVVALAMAWVFKKTLLRSEAPLLILELPPYKRPLARVVLRHMWERSKVFLQRAGTVILGINILLWFLATYPKATEVQKEFAARKAAVQAGTSQTPGTQDVATSKTAALQELEREEAGMKLAHSFAGRLGHAIEPIIAPLGFDWKIGVGIVTSFAAREVFVSTMSTVYNVGQSDSSGESIVGLAKIFQQQKRPDGSEMYTPLLGLTLMVFYVFALQCVSTVAIVRRETNSWRWPLFQWVYMGVLAWGFAFLTWRVGHLLGWH
jgi:ferrous iron transport protein B